MGGKVRNQHRTKAAKAAAGADAQVSTASPRQASSLKREQQPIVNGTAMHGPLIQSPGGGGAKKLTIERSSMPGLMASADATLGLNGSMPPPSKQVSSWAPSAQRAQHSALPTMFAPALSSRARSASIDRQ